MKILFSVNHPAHVHLFKNLIWQLQKKQHDILIVARKKEVTLDLLNIYNIKYELISEENETAFLLPLEMVQRSKGLWRIMKNFKPDMAISQMDPSLAIPSWLLGVPYVCLADSEPALTSLYGSLPFTNTVFTPECFRKNIGRKQIRYAGYKELAYLHPEIFKPNPSVLKEIGLLENEPYILLRFVSWNASHDIIQKGLVNKDEIVRKLLPYGRILISSEKKLPDELEQYRINISPEKIHDLLFYARILVTDSQTMTTEAAILGTPAIRCNSFVGKNDMGNFIELEKKYGLIINCSDEREALENSISILENCQTKNVWKEKRDKLLSEKINLTDYLIKYIENK